MNGLLIIDKAQGLTSHDVVRHVRRILKTRKVGHTGTLDPLATGVLPVAIGQGTRLVQYLLEKDKSYRTTLRLGAVTDTQDCTGKILDEAAEVDVDPESIREAVSGFFGTSLQLPPMYSAIKQNGTPLYRLARQGIEVERKEREIRISRLEILDIDPPDVTLEVDCSKGTYIRTLCHDIGQRLGVGAHLTSLRRTRSGIFDESQAISLETLQRLVDDGEAPPLLTPIQALADYPALELEAEAIARLFNGIPPELASVAGEVSAAEGDTVLLVTADRLLAIARFAPSRQKEARGDFELLKVFPDQ